MWLWNTIYLHHTDVFRGFWMEGCDAVSIFLSHVTELLRPHAYTLCLSGQLSLSYLSTCLSLFSAFIVLFCRERPAAIPIEIKSIDDTSHFDEFPDSDILTPTSTLHFVLSSKCHISYPVVMCVMMGVLLYVQLLRCATKQRPSWRTRTGYSSTTLTNASKASPLEEQYHPTWSQQKDEHLATGF